MFDAKGLDQSDFVLGRAEQTRRGLRSQKFFGMGIESDDNGSAARCSRMIGRSRNDRLMSAMNTVKDADGKEEGATQRRKFWNGMENLHELEIRNPKSEAPNKFKIQNPKFQNSGCRAPFEFLSLKHSNLFRISIFGFRAWLMRHASSKPGEAKEFAAQFLRAAFL